MRHPFQELIVSRDEAHNALMYFRAYKVEARGVLQTQEKFDVWKESLQAACEDRSFIGSLTRDEVMDQEGYMEAHCKNGAYITYLSNGRPGWFTLSYVEEEEENKRKHVRRTRCTTFLESKKRRVEKGLTQTFDRGDSLVYQITASARAKRAVDCWVGLAIRLGVVKDIRRMIGKMIMAERSTWIK